MGSDEEQGGGSQGGQEQGGGQEGGGQQGGGQDQSGSQQDDVVYDLDYGLREGDTGDEKRDS